MKPQTYANHRHNPWMTTIGYLFVGVAIGGFWTRWNHPGRVSFAIGLAGLTGAVIVLLGISRTYTTTLQDRIIKLEMKIRCAPLLNAEQQALYAQLTKKQIAALRFASDAEIPALVERAIREGLSPTDIKKAVRNWVPDYDRA